MKRLSIIIPVYNVEQYLVKCLDSVLHQDIPYMNYEVIVVNDGSLDNSVQVVQKVQEIQVVQEGFTNIKLVNRENGGLSAARNTGLEHAQGEYVWFVDSDDWIEPYCLSGILSKCQNNQLDVLCINLQLTFDDSHIEPYHIANNDGAKLRRGVDFLCNVSMPPAAVCGIYRREFLLRNKLRFYEGILHEDQEFTPRAYYLAKRIMLLDKPIYNYYQRTGSIMKSGKSVKRCKDLLTVADSLYSFMKLNVSETSCCYSYFQNVVNFCFSQSLAYYTKKAFPLAEYKRRAYYPLQNTSGLSLKYRIANFSLNLYLILLSFKNR